MLALIGVLADASASVYCRGRPRIPTTTCGERRAAAKAVARWAERVDVTDVRAYARVYPRDGRLEIIQIAERRRSAL